MILWSCDSNTTPANDVCCSRSTFSGNEVLDNKASSLGDTAVDANIPTGSISSHGGLISISSSPILSVWPGLSIDGLGTSPTTLSVNMTGNLYPGQDITSSSSSTNPNRNTSPNPNPIPRGGCCQLWCVADNISTRLLWQFGQRQQ